MGFFDSNSSSSTSNFSQQQEKNLAIASGATGISAENSTVNVVSTDSGAVRGAFDAIKASDAQRGKNYDKLLTTTSDIFDSGAGMFTDMTKQSGKNFDNLLSASGDLFAQGGANYKNMLNTTSDLFGKVFDNSGSNYEKLLSNTSTTMAGLIDGVASAQNFFMSALDTTQSKGTLDNRTITVIGLAVAAVLGLFLLKGKRA